MIEYYQNLLNECLDIAEHRLSQKIMSTMLEISKYNLERGRVQCSG